MAFPAMAGRGGQEPLRNSGPKETTEESKSFLRLGEAPWCDAASTSYSSLSLYGASAPLVWPNSLQHQLPSKSWRPSRAFQ